MRLCVAVIAGLVAAVVMVAVVSRLEAECDDRDERVRKAGL